MSWDSGSVGILSAILKTLRMLKRGSKNHKNKDGQPCEFQAQFCQQCPGMNTQLNA